MEKDKRIITAQEAKNLDLRAEEEFGISTLILMENAGRAVSEEALMIIARKRARIAIFCGRGNNGGDGFCAARHLLTAGVDSDIYLAGRVTEVKHAAKTNLDILLGLKKKVFEVNDQNLDIVRRRITGYSLIIDALLGVGLKGNVSGILAQLIELINLSGAYILSVDIPSGLDATGGRILGCSIKADRTITFVAKKSGMLKGCGRKQCGRIKIADIGVPGPILNRNKRG